VPVDRERLPGHDARPRVETRDLYDGKTYHDVQWRLPSGTRVESHGEPAEAHMRQLDPIHQGDRDPTPETFARVVSEALALPGTPGGYHFTMMRTWDALHAARRRDLRAFGWIEALCWADITLLEQGPERVFPDDRWADLKDRGGYPVAPAINTLSALYQREGFLAAAVDVEHRFAALSGAPRLRGDEAIARQQALLEEDGR